MSYFLKSGYTNICAVALDIGKCLQTAGYNLISVDGSSGSLPANADGLEAISFIVENTDAVDPCATTQKWRMKIDATKALNLRVTQATDKQIKDDGTVSIFPGSKKHDMSELLGGGVEGSGEGGAKNQFFTYAAQANEATPEAAPLSLMVVIAKHGISVCVWVEAMDNLGTAFSWFVTQRGVGTDGAPYKTGKAPLWTVYSVGGGGVGDVDNPNQQQMQGQLISQFVVCEADVHAPTKPMSANGDSPDGTRLMNVHQQVSMTEDEKFNLSLPRDLCTQRYFYPLELDMVGYSSADVISQYASSNVRMYGEGADRTYKAMQANAKNNKGMRLLFLVNAADKLIDISTVGA